MTKPDVLGLRREMSLHHMHRVGKHLGQAEMTLVGEHFAAVLPTLAAVSLPGERFWSFPMPKGNQFERRMMGYFTKDTFGLKRIPEPKAKLLMAALRFS